VRRVVRQQLIDLGYPVIEAENGNQALEMIEQIADIAIDRQRCHHARRHQWPPTGRPGAAATRTYAYRADERLYRRGRVSRGQPCLYSAKPFGRQDLVRALLSGNPGNAMKQTQKTQPN
jgi:CheY-like chemotaxis protein